MNNTYKQEVRALFDIRFGPENIYKYEQVIEFWMEALDRAYEAGRLSVMDNLRRHDFRRIASIEMLDNGYGRGVFREEAAYALYDFFEKEGALDLKPNLQDGSIEMRVSFYTRRPILSEKT
jgi:hypothetical protein